MPIKTTYLQYGVPSDWADVYASIRLPVTTFKSTSAKNLVAKYQLPADQVRQVKEWLNRKPINANVMQSLLQRSRFVCCLCRGQKGNAYIIHHIVPYSQTQDNEEANLAVLCPNDHDLVHREGEQLTQKISPEMVRKAKYAWQDKVVELDAQAASGSGDIHEVDFINVPRVLALYQELFQYRPATQYSSNLRENNIINEDGDLNPTFIEKHNSNPATPFIFLGPQQSWHPSVHYTEAFKQILQRISFQDLDLLLTKRKLRSENTIGTYCYYVGGLYGNSPLLPVTESSAPVHLYFHKRDILVEWLVDPRYMVSNTALHRLGERKEYLIYGVIRGIGTKAHNGKEYIHIDIRPYFFGMPTKTKNKRPAIHYKSRNPQPDFDDADEL